MVNIIKRNDEIVRAQMIIVEEDEPRPLEVVTTIKEDLRDVVQDENNKLIIICIVYEVEKGHD